MFPHFCSNGRFDQQRAEGERNIMQILKTISHTSPFAINKLEIFKFNM